MPVTFSLRQIGLEDAFTQMKLQPLAALFCTVSFVTLSACHVEMEEPPLDEESADASETEEHIAEVVDGMVSVFEGVDVAVPDDGYTLTIEVLFDDGLGELVQIERRGGEALVRYLDAHADEAGSTSSSAGSCPSKCSDKRHSLTGYRWNKKLAWRYRDANRPGSVSKSGAINAFKHAARGIVNSRNSCSMADKISATHEYLGTTSKAPGINGSGACTSMDNRNVIGWGKLPNGVLGVTCTWSTSSGVAVESDQRYSNQHKWFAGNTSPSNCSNKFSLRSVATHEFGHAYGLGHSACKLTMAPSTSVCKAGGRKLGKGDVLGLRKLY